MDVSRRQFLGLGLASGGSVSLFTLYAPLASHAARPRLQTVDSAAASYFAPSNSRLLERGSVNAPSLGVESDSIAVGLALSGGGSRGDFEVGVLRFLYKNLGISPRVITGTSVGAINAVKLAEGGDDAFDGLLAIWQQLRQNQHMYLEEAWVTTLDRDIREFLRLSAAEVLTTLTTDVIKYAVFPPFLILDLIKAGIDIGRFASAIDQATRSVSIYNLLPIVAKLSNPGLLDKDKVARSGIRLRVAAVSLETGDLRYITESGRLLGSRADVRRDGDWFLASNPGGGPWRWMLAGNSSTRGGTNFGNLTDPARRVQFWTGDFLGDGRTAILFYHPPDGNWWIGHHDGTQFGWQLVTNTSGFGDLADGRPFWTGTFLRPDQTAIVFYFPGDGNWWIGRYEATQFRWDVLTNTSGAIPDQAVLGNMKASTRSRFWTGHFTAEGRTNILFYSGTEQPVDLVQAVLASASIPSVFPPVEILNEHYVDGGVRDIIPIQAAIDSGADEVIAIVASPTGVPPASTRTFSNIVDIALRAGEQIMPDEIQKRGVSPPNGWPVKVNVIQPTVDVHDSMTIDPGLIAMSIDYGFMLAADVMVGSQKNPTRSRQLADQITALRKETWTVERDAGEVRQLGELTTIPSAEALRIVRRNKGRIRELVVERFQLGGVLPPEDVSKWWRDWEQHQWRPYISNPWDRFASRTGTLPAEDPPPSSYRD